MTDPVALEPAKLIALQANVQPAEFTIEADVCMGVSRVLGVRIEIRTPK